MLLEQRADAIVQQINLLDLERAKQQQQQQETRESHSTMTSHVNNHASAEFKTPLAVYAPSSSSSSTAATCLCGVNKHPFNARDQQQQAAGSESTCCVACISGTPLKFSTRTLDAINAFSTTDVMHSNNSDDVNSLYEALLL